MLVRTYISLQPTHTGNDSTTSANWITSSKKHGNQIRHPSLHGADAKWHQGLHVTGGAWAGIQGELLDFVESKCRPRVNTCPGHIS